MVRTADWEPKFEDEEIQTYLLDLAGEPGTALFKLVLDKEPITGIEILEAYEEERPSDVRKLLYRLMMGHALEYHSDRDRTGWETFHWRTDLPELKLVLQRRWAEELQDLRKNLRFEQDHQFYACADHHERVVFEDAFDVDFKCPTCSTLMDPRPNDEVVAALQERTDALEAALTT